MHRRIAISITMALSAAASAQWSATILNPAGASESAALASRNGYQAGFVTTAGSHRAALWSGTAASFLNLDPGGDSFESEINGIADGQQVGYIKWSDGNLQPAASLWSGTASSRIDLHADQMWSSNALATDGQNQAGWAIINNVKMASMWSGSAASWTSLHPVAGVTESAINGIGGGQQVGYVQFDDGNGQRAASLWTGSADARVDLHAGNLWASDALATDGVQQVGWTDDGSQMMHASLWTGTADSRIDLHPSGSAESSACGVSGGKQVGYARIGGQPHASVWSGTAASWVDLHTFLPPGYSSSVATSISGSDLDIQISGYAHNTLNNRDEAVVWNVASTQCGPHWRAAETVESVRGGVSALTMWDADGNGPQTAKLTVGGNYGIFGHDNMQLFDIATRTWSHLSGGIQNHEIFASAALPSGDLIAGGCVGAQIAEIVYSNTSVGRWTPSGQWIDMTADFAPSSGFDYEGVYAMVVLPNGRLVAGGLFSTTGNPVASNIAEWNGASWIPLGSGISGKVSALTLLPNHDLIAVGDFSSAGGVVCNRVARWNGTAWSGLGTGIQGSARAVAAMPNGDLIVGGIFSYAINSANVNNIVRWNGSAWSPLGTGTNGPVTAITALPDGHVLGAGNFTMAGGNPANRMSEWDGTTWSGTRWSSHSAGAFGQFQSFLMAPNGELFAGGSFSTGGVPQPFLDGYHFGTHITAHPAATSACYAHAAAFSVHATSISTLTYRWCRDSVPISLIDNPSAGTAALTISSVHSTDAGSYDCIISDECGSVTSNAAMLSMCASDFNCDGTTDFFDYLDFVAAFAAAASVADFNNDNVIDFFDYLDFVQAFSAGC